MRPELKRFRVECLVTVEASDQKTAEDKLFKLLWGQSWVQRVRCLATGEDVPKEQPAEKRLVGKTVPHSD